MSAAKLAAVLLIVASSFLGGVENKSIFGIGTRIIGDQLLVKDVLRAPPASLSSNPSVRFNYAIPEPITYIEITSEESVLAEVNFSYDNDLVKGTVIAINSTLPSAVYPSTFEILITIYGFNETVLNLNSAYVLNRDHDFQGVLEPLDGDDYLNLSDEALDQTHADDEEFGLERTSAGIGADDDDDDDDDDDGMDFEDSDAYLELGYRQGGDYKIFECVQTSLTTTAEPTNHSVTFYYVDSNFVTYAIFKIFDSDVDKASSATTQKPPIADYSHLSPTTLKAVITDPATTSLFVEMHLYGYRPEDLPPGYVPLMPAASPVTSMPPFQRVGQMMADVLQQELGTSKDGDDDGDDDNNDDDDDDDDDDGVPSSAPSSLGRPIGAASLLALLGVVLSAAH